MITVYGSPISEISHRITALLAVLDLDYKYKALKPSKGRRKQTGFLEAEYSRFSASYD